MQKEILVSTLRHLYEVGDVVSNQNGHLRVILAVNPEDKKLTAHYEFMELEPLTGGSYFIQFPKGKKSIQDIWNFDKLHYLYKVK